MNSRVRKIALWTTISITISVLLSIAAFKAVMQSRLISRRDAIASALQSSESVRLEEFEDDGKIRSQRELTAEQRLLAIESIQGDLAGGTAFTLSMCFVPHHRMIARDAKGLEFTFTICFECDEAAITGSEPFSMPFRWRSLLRGLFQSGGFHGIKPDG